MEKFISGLGIGVLGAALVFVLAIISGTILFWIAPVVFGYFAANGLNLVLPTWWQAVCFTWFLSIIGSHLFKSSTVNKAE